MAAGDHMTPQEFRELGHRYVDWVASYWERVGELPVQPAVVPGVGLRRAARTAHRPPAATSAMPSTISTTWWCRR